MAVFRNVGHTQIAGGTRIDPGACGKFAATNRQASGTGRQQARQHLEQLALAALLFETQQILVQGWVQRRKAAGDAVVIAA